jgi:hypothetical protein
VAVLWLPGGLVGIVAGLRGWTLAASAPLLTYAIAGLAGPLLSAVGIRWSPASFLLTATVIVAMSLVARAVTGTLRPRPAVRPSPWNGAAQVFVGATMLVAAAVGGFVVLGGIGHLDALQQEWDAVFHANGIRLIADTGDGGVFGMGHVNWYEGNTQYFYPNAYHLVAAIIYTMSGASITAVLNAHTVLIPGLIALGLVALVNRTGQRPMVAASTAIIVVTASVFYDMLWRGPLLPFATGVALAATTAVLAIDQADAVGARSVLRSTLLLAAALAGLLAMHPSVLISGALFVLPAMLQRWFLRPRRLPREACLLVVAGLLAAGASTIQLLGARTSAKILQLIDWRAELSRGAAVEQLVTFGHSAPTAQWPIAIAFAVGVILIYRFSGLQWLLLTAIGFGGLFVVAAASDAPWANELTSIWWNDRWRLVALAALPMCIIAAHGVSEVQRGLSAALTAAARFLARRRDEDGPGTLAPVKGRGQRRVAVVTVMSAAVALGTLVVATNGLDIVRNQQRMSSIAGDGPSDSPLEVTAMQAISRIVPAGTRVMNDRGDGSAWMYALDGVVPVAGHYDGARIGPDATLLAQRFNQYPTDPAVRAAVQRLGIGYAYVAKGFLRPWGEREPGLVGLEGQSWLRPVYENPDAVLYQILPVTTDAP